MRFEVKGLHATERGVIVGDCDANERTLSLHPGSPPLQSRGHHPTLKRRERERERKKEREGEKRKYVLSHPRVRAVHGLALSSGCLDHQHVQGMPSVLLVAELTLYRGGVSEQVRQYHHQLSKFTAHTPQAGACDRTRACGAKVMGGRDAVL